MPFFPTAFQKLFSPLFENAFTKRKIRCMGNIICHRNFLYSRRLKNKNFTKKGEYVCFRKR